MTLDEAIAAMKLHARQLEAVQTIASAISKAKDIDNLTQEAEQRRVARQKEVDAASAVLEKTRAEIAAGEKQLFSLKEKAKQIVEAAEAKASKKTAEADSAYNLILDRARTEAAAILQPVKDAADAKRKEHDDLSVMANALDAQIASKSAELDKINAQIEKARDLLKRFIA